MQRSRLIIVALQVVALVGLALFVATHRATGETIQEEAGVHLASRPAVSRLQAPGTPTSALVYLPHIERQAVCRTVWRAFPVPGSRLGAVAALSPGDVWVVRLPDLLHWDGAAWGVTSIPRVGAAANVLMDLAARATDDIWGVGGYLDDLDHSHIRRTLILRWNGHAWLHTPSPSPGITASLSSVAAIAPDDVWAVGVYRRSSQGPYEFYDPLVLHWDGTDWTEAPLPPLGFNAQLWGVHAVSSTDVWAVGSFRMDASGNDVALILHWDGAQWSRVPLPDNLANLSQLTGVAASARDDVWAVGPGLGVILHWDGATWSGFPLANSGVPLRLSSVAALASNNVWAAGANVDSATVLHWDGTVWRPTYQFRPSGPVWLSDLDATPAVGAWVSGYYIQDGSEHELLIHSVGGCP